MTHRDAVTLDRFLRRQEDAAPNARELAILIGQMSFAAKLLGRELRRAALVGRLGLVGEKNPSGDAQKKLDVFANEVVVATFAETKLVTAIVSEEMEELKVLSCGPEANFILCIDPLDGSSNTDVNGPLGTVFAFYRKTGEGGCFDVEAELKTGAELVAAGYVLYGSSTMLVYSLGQKVHGFTLDQDLGEFLLSHEEIRCPEEGSVWSANVGRYPDWSPGVRGFADELMDGPDGVRRSLRFSGALVADVHRSLLEGGIYFYPQDEAHPEGKLRLLYECAPLAFVVEAAGGAATDGSGRILELTPKSLHQKVPFVVGSTIQVERFRDFATGVR